MSNNNRFLIQPKDEIRELIGCSPDLLDALALTCMDRTSLDDPGVKLGTAALSRQQEVYRDKALSMMGA